MAVMLLEWIFTAIFLILVVLALRAALGRRISARMRYALWAVVLVRLLVPVQLFTSPVAGTWVVTEKRVEHSVAEVPSAPAGLGDAPSLSGQHEPALEVGQGVVPSLPDPPSLPDAPEPPAAPDLTKAPVWLGWVWLAGTGLTVLVLLLSNLRFYWRLRRERVSLEGADCPLAVYVAPGLPSPCLFGLIRPAVYVTPDAAVDPDMLRHVLAHEYTHYKHGDHVWSLLRCAALAVHWWNPLVWTAAVLSQRDGELACDEGALRRLGDGQRAAYGSTLLALVTAKPRPGDLFRCATTMAGDKKSLKERIARIAQAPKRVLWAVVAVVMVTALACLCAFGQAEPAEPPDDAGELTPIYTMDGDRYVLIEGVGGAHVEWSRGTNGGSLYLAEDLGRLCPRLAGETAEGGADWEDAEKSVLHVGLNVNDDRLRDGTVNGFRINFTVDLGSDTVIQKEFTSQLGDRTIELTDQEMLDMAHILARLLTEAEDWYLNRNIPVYTMSESGMVLINGLDGAHLEWHGPDTSPSGGWLYFTNPGFCCPSLAGKQAEGSAQWADGDKSALSVVMNVNDERVESGTVTGFYINFNVELDSGKVLKRVFDSQIEGETLELTGQEMVDMARALAKLLAGAEDYYNSLQPAPEVEIACDAAAVGQDVLDAVKADVAEKYREYAPNGVRTSNGVYYNDETNQWEPALLAKAIRFDGARINQLDGPWTNTVLGMDIEVWRINYEFHTTTPEFAENTLAGGNYFTEDGWLCPTYPSCTYEIFVLDETGGRSFASSIMYNMGGPSENEEESAGFFYYFYPRVAQELSNRGLVDPEGLTPDLNRNGVPETLRSVGIGGNSGRRLEVWEGDELIFSEEGYFAHAGCNALFLYHDYDGGGDYLLRYNPYMAQGSAFYAYQLFTLENGEETAVRWNELAFDIDIGSPRYDGSFDPNAIAAFVEEVNVLLSHSVQLLNTDADLLATFEKNGRLYDDLGWLDQWAPVYVRGGRMLSEELWCYKAAMEGRQYGDEPTLALVSRGTESTLINLRYRDKVTRFCVDYWDMRFPTEPQLLDLNGDGKDEIVFVLVMGTGTGCLVEELYAFDAATLEQYDTSDLNKRILDSIQSTGDGENFYLSAPWMDRVTVPKAGVGAEGVPMADALALGEIIEYSIENGRVICRLGCDASGRTTNYIGYLDITLGLAPQEGFRCVSGQYSSAE